MISRGRAWGLAFAWRSMQPTVHHLPRPQTALAAIALLALLRGWQRVAALFLAGWVGLLRPGEMLAARRADLVLPRDINNMYPSAQFALGSPTTRLVVARQSVKIERRDAVLILDSVFGHLPQEELL